MSLLDINEIARSLKVETLVTHNVEEGSLTFKIVGKPENRKKMIQWLDKQRFYNLVHKYEEMEAWK